MTTNEVKVRSTKEMKRKEALIRLQNRNSLTAAEQLGKLNAFGFTAKKERTRLCKLVHLDFDESLDFWAVEKAKKAGM